MRDVTAWFLRAGSRITLREVVRLLDAAAEKHPAYWLAPPAWWVGRARAGSTVLGCSPVRRIRDVPHGPGSGCTIGSPTGRPPAAERTS